MNFLGPEIRFGDSRVDTKDFFDTINSVCWFLMDASWMFGATTVGLGFIVPTVLTGIILLIHEKRPNVFWINVAINCWIAMNSLWMLSDTFKNAQLLFSAKIVFMMGLVSMGVAAQRSSSFKETFSHFRRFRAFKIRS